MFSSLLFGASWRCLVTVVWWLVLMFLLIWLGVSVVKCGVGSRVCV